MLLPLLLLDDLLVLLLSLAPTLLLHVGLVVGISAAAFSVAAGPTISSAVASSAVVGLTCT